MQSLVKKRGQPNSSQLLLLFSIILLAVNMRAPLTSVGPLVTLIRDSLAISSAAAGALTAIPLLAFAFLSPYASKAARKFGMEAVLFTALLVLAAGLIIRLSGSTGALFAGTILVGAAIAFCNVILPAFVKMNFAHQIGVMTGFYVMAMNLAGALASGFSIPIAASSDLGWRAAIGFWVIPAGAAMLIWMVQLRFVQRPLKSAENTYKKTPLKHSWLAWKITAFMGLQSLLFYSLIAWLPDILQEQGLDAVSAGWMLSIIQFTQLPFTFAVPILAGRMKNQTPLVVIASCFMIIGLSGILMAWTELMLLWIILIGIAGGFAFSLAMMFFSLRTRNSFEAADLSGMAQSAGYLFAASGPALLGMLHDKMNGWDVPLIVLLLAAVCLLAVGLGAAREGFVAEKIRQ